MKKTLMLSFAYALVIAGFAYAGGDAAADKKKAAEDRKKANDLSQQAAKNHDQAVKDFDAAVALQVKADEEAGEAHTLFVQAMLLDKEAAKEIQIEHLKIAIAREQLLVTYWKNAVTNCQNRDKALGKKITDEEKSINDLKGAMKTETNANAKNAEEAAIESDEADVKNLQAEQSRVKAVEAEDQKQVTNHENQLKNDQAALKKLGG
ncbi:MAG TPA: hypothetical protein VFF73_11890 [Planctomycetota bacterium]|nr:hypothetical protein [Planctomycetota bacterium]